MRHSQRKRKLVIWLILFVFGANVLPAQAELPSRAVITADNAHRLQLYKVIGNKIPSPSGPDFPMSEIGLVFSRNGEQLAFNYPNADNVQIMDVASGKVLHKLSFDNKYFYRAFFSRDGTKLYTLDYDDIVRVWEIGTKNIWELPTGRINSNIALSRDQSLLAVGSFGPELWIFNIKDRSVVQHIAWGTPGHFQTVRRVLFNPDGTQLLVITNSSPINPAEGDAEVIVFDVQTGERLTELQGNADTAGFWASLSPEGTWAIVSTQYTTPPPHLAYDAKSVWIWDITRKTSQPLFSSEQPIEKIIFSSTGEQIGLGERFVSCNLSALNCTSEPLDTHPHTQFGSDGTIVLDLHGVWSVAQNQLIFSFPDQENLPHPKVIQADLSPDGTMIGALFVDGTIQLWTVPAS